VAFFISEPGIRRTEPSVVVAPPRTPHAWTLTVSRPVGWQEDEKVLLAVIVRGS